MRFLNVIGSSMFQIVSLIFVMGYFLGALNIHFSDRNDYCVMTYMYEYPQFVKIEVSEDKQFPQYGLYAYSEGRFTERARKMWFDGIPVLYLPGNSGSHMQARSLASVALRKAMNHHHDFHFDFFTINYNEELSGLYGGVLYNQLKYASFCLKKILSLYSNNSYTKNVPSSVILIGHSMGGAIAQRLLALPSTMNITKVAITLAAPLEAPVVNFDVTINEYYMHMKYEWEVLAKSKEIMKKKMLLSFGNGPRDILMPASLTSSKYSFISSLTTAIPGVWVSPDHVSIVWCKQLVLTINRFLFDIVDPKTMQLSENKGVLKAKALQYFQANRSMILDPNKIRPNVTMIADAFWYEDNRRIYQISRPEIDRTTYLMIRLVKFPQNRFVAVEAVNVDDKDWVFGCNAKYTYQAHRYCQKATSLTELSRWTGVAADFGRRKLATVHLHKIMEEHPDWSHVVVKVSPSKKPVVLNVDINDHASREITVDLPSLISFGKQIIKEETEERSLYYELILPGFTAVHQAYLLHVEPTPKCKAVHYHVSAEVHIPWARNHDYYHYFTHLKQTPLKLRLYKSNLNVSVASNTTEHVKVTLLLDPQCTYTISISSSWYNRLAQLVRNYTPVLVPYLGAALLLAARSIIQHLHQHGTCVSIHSALMSDGVKPYYVLVVARLGAFMLMSVPVITYLFENSSWGNLEIISFTRSILVFPAYMTAVGLLNIGAAVVLVTMVTSSQLAHKLLFRIVWRGGAGLAESVASGLQKVPMVVSGTLIVVAPLSCGAASLVAGAAFYGFMLSKMYEEYLEDYIYRLMAKFGSKVCRFFKPKNRINTENVSETSLVTRDNPKDEINEPTSDDLKTVDNKLNNDDKKTKSKNRKRKKSKDESKRTKNNMKDNIKFDQKDETANETDLSTKCDQNNEKVIEDFVDDALSDLNFHMMMFFLWLAVTLLNAPVLLTWARNFKYRIVLKPDTSYPTGLIMSACSACIWQVKGPRRNLKCYDAVSALLFTMAIIILVIGPLSMSVVNYCITFVFAVITLQQLCDQEEGLEQVLLEDYENEEWDEDNNKPTAKKTSAQYPSRSNESTYNRNVQANKNDDIKNSDRKDKTDEKERNENEPSKSQKEESDNEMKRENKDEDVGSTSTKSEDCPCDEKSLYNTFKNLKDKFSFSNEE